MDGGKAIRCSVAGISLLVFFSALALAFGASLSTVSSAYAQSDSSSSDPSWSVSSSTDWWEQSKGSAENDVRTTVKDGSLRLTGENLVGYWSMDSFPSGFGSTDNTVYDLTSYQNDGTAENGPTIDNGMWDNALYFDASNNTAVTAPTPQPENTTLMAWVYHDGDLSGYSYTQVNFLGHNNETRICYNTGDVAWGAYNGSTWVEVSEAESSAENVWRFVVLRFDGSTAYLDVWGPDSKVGENTASWSSFTYDSSTVHIGSCGGSNYWTGPIGEVMSFNRALSDNEIKRIYERTKPDNMAGGDLKTGTWTSQVWDSGASENQEVDNLEFTISQGTGENIYANIGVDKDNNGTIDDNTGWNQISGDVWDSPSLDFGLRFQVDFKLETDNTTHSPSVSDYTLNVITPPPFEVSSVKTENIGTFAFDFVGSIDNLRGVDNVNIKAQVRESGTSAWDNYGLRNENTVDNYGFSISGLEHETTYEVRIQGENSPTIENGAVLTATTDNWVDTNSAASIGFNSVTLNGNLVALKDSDSDNVSFYWRENGATSWNQTSYSVKSSTGSFSKDLTDFDEGTTYEFKANVVGSSGDNGAVKTFTTKAHWWDVQTQSDWENNTSVGENYLVESGKLKIDNLRSSASWESVNWGSFFSENQLVDNLEYSHETSGVLYGWIGADTDDDGAIDENTGWIKLENDYRDISISSDGRVSEEGAWPSVQGKSENQDSVIDRGEMVGKGNYSLKWTKNGISGGYSIPFYSLDYDEDGSTEIFAIDYNAGSLLVLEGSDGNLEENITKFSTDMRWWGVADLNGDGDVEFMVNNIGDNFIALNNNFDVMWTYDYTLGGEKLEGQPQVVDSDSDGMPEVFFATTTAPNTNGGHAILINGENGTVKWSDSISSTQGWRGQGAFDADNDGSIEFFAGIRYGGLWSWENDGALRYSDNGPTGGWHTGPVFADLNDNGFYDLWYAEKDGDGYRINQANGTSRASVAINGQSDESRDEPEGATSVVDVDNDGTKEFIASSRGDTFIARASDMSLEKQINTDSHSAYVTVADLDGDGIYEFTTTTENNSKNNLSIYEWDNSAGTADLTLEYQVGLGSASDGRKMSYTSLGDVDDDNVLEVLQFEGNSQTLNVIDTGGAEPVEKDSWSPSISGYEFEVRFKMKSDPVDNFTLNVSPVPNVAPNIESISVDNTLIDRNRDYSSSGAVTATQITVRVRDNDNRSDIAPLRFSLRDNNDSLLVDNVEVTENSVVDENTLDFTYTFDPSDTLADDNLGKFDVRSEARDNAGACHVENFLELGHAKFTVSDRKVENIAFENDYEHVLKVTANSARIVGSASVTSSTLTDNNLGDYSMGSDLAVSYETTQDGKVTVKATDENVDGISSSKSYIFPNFHPSIESISVDNALIDRDNDTGVFSSTENTTISVSWSDPDNRTNDLTSEADALLSIRDNTDVAVLSEENIIGSKTSVDENTIKTSYTFNPSDSLGGENIGDFDVKFKGVDKYGMENVSDYAELGENLFTVTDLNTTLNISDTNPAKGDIIAISGTASRAFGTVSLDNVMVEINGKLHQADFDNDNWSYQHTVQASGGSTVDVGVHLMDKGSSLDGYNSGTFTVQGAGGGKIQYPFNPTKQNLSIDLKVGLYRGKEPTKGGRIEFKPSSKFKPGDRVTVVAYLTVDGIKISHADITGSWNGNPFPMKDKKANRFVGTFTIPKGARPGSYLVSVDASARGLQSTASKTITVLRAKKGINLVKLAKDYWWVIVIAVILLLIALE